MRTINGLVTRCSSVQRSAEPIGERASSKLKVRGTAPLYAATKPKARSTNGFFAFCRARTPHDSKHPSRGGAEGKRTRYATVWLMMALHGCRAKASDGLMGTQNIRSRFDSVGHHQSHGLGGSSRTIRGAGRIIKPRGWTQRSHDDPL